MSSMQFKALSLLVSVFAFAMHASDEPWFLKNAARASTYSCCRRFNKAWNPAVPFAVLCSSAITTKLACDSFGIEMTEENAPKFQASVLGESILQMIGAEKVLDSACDWLANSCAINLEKKND